MGPGNVDPNALTPREQAVAVYQGTIQPACQVTPLGVIEAMSGSAFKMGSFESTVAVLKKKAAALGAEGIIVTEHFKNGMADQATATAFRCAEPAAPSPSSPQ